MNLPKPSAAVLCLIVCARPLLAADSSGPPDMVLFNGKVFTADASHPHVQGLAIRGDRIMETGESVAIRALSGPHTRLIDLGGHTVIPGINDAHQHLFVTPPELIAVQLKSRDPPWSEVRDAIQAAARSAGPRQGIFATIGPTVLEDHDACTHPDRPSEALTREEAVIAYTLGSAYAELLEGDKGSLAKGKLADLAVLSQDIFTVPVEQLPSTVSILTMIGGAIVYEAHAGTAP
jgi:predicted amidohydrolase YtcJ